MQKKCFVLYSSIIVVMLMISSSMDVGSVQTGASADRVPALNKQPLSMVSTNDTTNGGSPHDVGGGRSDNGITWTDAQDNYLGNNGFSYFEYPIRAIVKNAIAYTGIKPSNTVFAYVAAMYSDTLTVLNATRSWAQTEYSSYSVSSPHDIQLLDYPLYGRVAFVCSYDDGGLYALNVTNPHSITTLDSRDDSNEAGMYMDVDSVNNILYFTDYNSNGNDYLYAYNITNPHRIDLICKAVVPQGKPWCPKVNINNPNYVYVACEGDGSYAENGSVAIFNVTWVRNATNPSMKYMKTQGFGSFADLKQDGNYLYGDSGPSSSNPPVPWALHIWNVSNPTNLTTVSVTSLQTYGHFCLVTSPSGHDYAFLRHYDTSYGDYGVNIADINDKSSPVKIGYIPDDGGGHTRDLWRCHWMQCAYNNITNIWVLYVIGYMDDSWVTFNITFNHTSPLVANFNYSPSNPTNTTIVHFTDTSTDSNGTIVSWSWDFGDQNTSLLQNPNHRYDFDGIYTVNLTVTDTHGVTDSIEKTITVYTPPNSPPNPPSNPSPANGAVTVPIDTSLGWTGGDPNPGDTVTYDVYFGTTSTPVKVAGNQSGTTYNPGVLSFGTTYYWKIVAWDNHGASTTGPTWDFKTNSQPNMPSNPIPPDHTTGMPVNTVVSWTGGDPDPSDTVTYDVYFGVVNPPTKVVGNQSGTSYNPGTLTYGTTYYWKIVSWDNHGASTTGPLWDFKTNSLPNVPSNPNPLDHTTGIPVNTVVSWTGGDPDPSDTVTYDVYFGVTNPPSKVVSNQSATTYNPGTLNFGTTYNWKIVAWDNHGASTAGPTWDFKTNSLPNVPTNPNPHNNATNVPVNAIISWTGGDPDSGDTVLYDVYFGVTNPPTKAASNQSGTTYNPGTLTFGTTYYWMIVSWDNHGASTGGPLWQFTTHSNAPPGAPVINGPSSGKPGRSYDYTFVAVDSEGDNISYEINWGDGTVDNWYGPVESNVIITRSHTWKTKGTFTIQARAKDIHGAVGEWGTLMVVMPLENHFQFLHPFLWLLQQLFQRFPHAFPLLRHLLGS